jgi:hypothetical protein
MVWFPTLVRGKLHLELLPVDFPGETGEGAALLVEKVRAALNVRFPQGPKPRMLFVDRGKGFYARSTAKITPPFKAALRQHHLTAFMGDDAGAQPGTLAQLLLHETAVAWVRARQTITTPKKPWTETREAFGERLRAIARHINTQYRVDDLCREFPGRIQQLIDVEGDNLKK